MNTAQHVHDVMMYCLFKDEEPKDNPVMAQGIVSTFGFHPVRLAEKRNEIIDIVRRTVSDDFYEAKGGGMSFLQLPFDRQGGQWGEHRDAEALMSLSIALGIGKILLPREMWQILPGGMPYVAFNLAGFEE